jgi:hypothetical protein
VDQILSLYLFLGSLALLVIVFLTETILGARWNRRYFITGVPLTTITIPVDSFHTNLPPVQLLATKNRSWLLGSLAFRQIAPDAYGFRFRLLQLSLPFRGMHGGLAFDRLNHCVILRSFLNLTDIALALVMLAVVQLTVLTDAGDWLGGLTAFSIVALVLLLEVVALRINRRRCVALATFAAAAWERKREAVSPQLSAVSQFAPDGGDGAVSDRARARRLVQRAMPSQPQDDSPQMDTDEQDGE